jgi:hypothetical protein
MGVRLVSYSGSIYEIELETADASIGALKTAIQAQLSFEPSLQKLIFKGKTLSDETPAPSADQGKIMLLVSSQAAIAHVNDTAQAAAQRHLARQNRQTGKLNKTAMSLADTTYRFHRLSCLTHLPQHERSLAYLHRLADDRCIKKLMQREKYTVGHLTEMDPRLHTTHDGKTLGLNKNAGQEILLRLRTDTLDGWRDYKDVRATLLHELVHNVFGDHDKNFFALLGQHKKDVHRWETGHTLQEDAVFRPSDMSSSDCGTRSETHTLGSSNGSAPVNAREAQARAAEARAARSHKLP